MKQVLSLLLAVTFAGIMLLPVTSHFNLFSGNRIQTADGGGGGGVPVPPWPGC